MGKDQAEAEFQEDRAQCPDCQQFNIPLIESKFTKKKYRESALCLDCQVKKDEKDRKAEEERRIFARERRRNNLKEYLANAGVPPLFQNCTLDNYQGSFPEYPPSLISGPPGTGKTHLAVGYLGRNIIERNQGRFMMVVDLMAQLRDSFNADTGITEYSLLKTWVEIPFLVLDDLGHEKLTDYTQQTIYHLINYRMVNQAPTIITSNLSLYQIAERYAPAVASRICAIGEVLIVDSQAVDWRVKRKITNYPNKR